jgi:hypothetical protein
MWNGSNWVPVGGSGTSGQVLTWNATGGYWYAATPTLAGASSVQSIEANAVSIGNSAINISSFVGTVSTFTMTLSGYTQYHVTFTATMQSNASGGQAQLCVAFGTGGIAVSPVGNTVGVYETTANHDNMVVFQKALTGLSSATAYTFTGYAAVTGGTSQQIVNGVLTVMGVQ